MPSQPKPAPILLNRFYVLDFDRCLADPVELYQQFVTILDQAGIISLAEAANLRQATESDGGSFDLLHYLRITQHVSEQTLSPLLDRFVATVRAQPLPVRMDGADELLRYLERSGAGYGIITYGAPDWQTAKLRASGLDRIPYIITLHKHKAHDIAAWFDTDTLSYRIPPTLADNTAAAEVILVDDKASAFDGLPASARGYWVQSSDGLLPGQRGHVPATVRTVFSLREVVRFETDHDNSSTY